MSMKTVKDLITSRMITMSLVLIITTFITSDVATASPYTEWRD